MCGYPETQHEDNGQRDRQHHHVEPAVLVRGPAGEDAAEDTGAKCVSDGGGKLRGECMGSDGLPHRVQDRELVVGKRIGHAVRFGVQDDVVSWQEYAPEEEERPQG